MKNGSMKMDVILITETNFALDIVFKQSSECERLLDFILEQGVRLVIPEYAFAEAEGSIVTTIQNRLSAINSALDALKQSARSSYYALDEFITHLQQYKDDTEKVEINVLHSSMKELQEIADVITFEFKAMLRAELRRLRQIAPFKNTDSVIYESILEFAYINRNSNTKMIFLTRDRKDFDFPYIRDELSSINAEIFFSAGDCIKRIRELI